jgi:transposase
MQWGFPCSTWALKPPLFIRPLTNEERRHLEADQRTADACRVRRAQSVLASAQKLSPQPIAQLVGGSVQTVRTVLTAFNTRGVAGLEKQSTRPKTGTPVLDAAHCDRLQPILHQSPRTYDKPTGVWTLALAAEVGYEQGVTERLRSAATGRRALQRLQTNGKRAKHGITSPDPHYARKKSGARAIRRAR